MICVFTIIAHCTFHIHLLRTVNIMMLMKIPNSFPVISSFHTTTNHPQHYKQTIRQKKHNNLLNQQQCMKRNNLFIFLLIYDKVLCEYLL